MQAPPNRPVNGRLNAKRFFLTYAQCGELSKERLADFLLALGGVTGYTVGLEQHEGGGNHLHAYVEFGDRLDSRDMGYFDVDGRHPNISAVRNAANVINYCQKEGDFIGNVSAEGSTTIKYGEILQLATGQDDFLDLVGRHYPRDSVLYHGRLLEYAEWRWGDKPVEYAPTHTSFVEPDGLAEWRAVNMESQVFFY